MHDSGLPSSWDAPGRPGDALSKAALWIAGFVAGLLAGAAGERRRLPHRAALNAMVGRSKEDILRELGPPPSAAILRSDAPPGMPSLWQADTWYYPLDPKRRLAVAITFARGVAQEVAWIKGPA